MNTKTVALVVSVYILSLSFPATSAERQRLHSATAVARVSSFFSRFTPHWPMAFHDPVASSFNPVEKHIGIHNAHQLEVKWIFDATVANHPVGPMHATPIVLGDAIYVGDTLGRFYAISRDGALRWEYVTRPFKKELLKAILTPAPSDGPMPEVAGTPIVGAAVIPPHLPYVIFGDLAGNIYALNRHTGEEVWVQEAVDPHPLGGVGGNALLVIGNRVVIGFSSLEDLAFVLPQYDCCTHRGFVVALQAATGEELWRFEPIPATAVHPLPDTLAPFKIGPAGADIWGQPTYDRQSHTIFIGTGQNFSPSSTGDTPGSDAIMALDADTGTRKWATQFTSGDIWVTGLPNPDATGRFLDQDVGDSPKVYRLADGRKVVGAGQKSGVYHVLDAHTGAVIASTPHLQQANILGGFQQGGALAYGRVFQHGLHGLPPLTGEGPFLGTVVALSLDGTTELWRWEKPFALLAGGLAVANGVVFFQSPIEESVPLQPPIEWALYALHAFTGETLLRMPFPGRAVTGPVVSQSRVYFGKGNTAINRIGEDFDGGLICLGLANE
jgi:polyvinyl alcohol dehydrogenase (cytochrome)